MVVRKVSNMGEFQKILKESGKRLIVVDFYADWCGPCRMIAPFMEQLSEEFSAGIFLKVNVDHSRDIAGTYQIRAMPTFVFISKSGEIDRMQGASPQGLKSKIQNWINYLGPVATPVAPAKPNPKAANDTEKLWLSQLVKYTDKVMEYEDEIAQTLAKSLLPLERMLEKVTLNGKRNDFLLASDLMNWFHDEFFEWTNTPKCDFCHETTSRDTRSNGTPTEEERNEGGAQIVEVYFCQKCKKEVRFPRFNNPIKLLETRNGRCGEWANCFALFCRAADLETRFVIDNADHVWVEIYSNEKKRWIHCDPCENIMDVPLLYEKGWKKQLNYVFAFAKDHVMDVTWRYTFNREKTTKNRKQVRPIVLINFFNKLNARLQKNLPAERKKILEKRFLAEIIEFIWPMNNVRKKSEENQGRNSGSLDWKLERGETGSSCVGDSLSPIVITPSQAEIDFKCFEIIYDASKDEYARTNDSNLSTKKWESQIFEVENIFRKIENDWKKAYLARKQGSKKGVLVWKINLKDLKAKQVEICLNSFKTGSGNVFGTVCCGTQCQRLGADGIIKLDDVKDADYLELRLELSGGDGEVAWQHSQLFRTDLENGEPGLKIRVEFE